MSRGLAVLSTVAALAVLLAACGGGDGTSVETAETAAGPEKVRAGAEETGTAAEARPDPGARPAGEESRDKAGNAAPAPVRAPGQRTLPSGVVQSLPPSKAAQTQALDNSYESIKGFGSTPGSTAETTAITSALQGYLSARAEGDWGAACTALSAEVRSSLANYAAMVEEPNPGCAEILGAFLSRAPQRVLALQAQIDVAEVRVEGERAFVIYSTPETISAAMPLYREDGSWKVGAFEANAL